MKQCVKCGKVKRDWSFMKEPTVKGEPLRDKCVRCYDRESAEVAKEIISKHMGMEHFPFLMKLAKEMDAINRKKGISEVDGVTLKVNENIIKKSMRAWYDD